MFFWQPHGIKRNLIWAKILTVKRHSHCGQYCNTETNDLQSTANDSASEGRSSPLPSCESAVPLQRQKSSGPPKKHGLQSRDVSQVAKYAYYVHCCANRLNLVLVDCCKALHEAREFFSLLEKLYAFSSGSLAHIRSALYVSFRATAPASASICHTVGVPRSRMPKYLWSPSCCFRNLCPKLLHMRYCLCSLCINSSGYSRTLLQFYVDLHQALVRRLSSHLCQSSLQGISFIRLWITQFTILRSARLLLFKTMYCTWRTFVKVAAGRRDWSVLSAAVKQVTMRHYDQALHGTLHEGCSTPHVQERNEQREATDSTGHDGFNARMYYSATGSRDVPVHTLHTLYRNTNRRGHDSERSSASRKKLWTHSVPVWWADRRGHGRSDSRNLIQSSP